MKIKQYIQDIRLRISAAYRFYKIMNPKSNYKYMMLFSYKPELHRFIEGQSELGDNGVSVLGNMSQYEIYGTMAMFKHPDENELVLMKAMDQIKEEGYAE